MQKRDFGKLGFQTSAFGMGCMRLPKIIKDGKATVDREKAYELIRYAADNGVNYFDTAYVYHNMESEEVLGEALAGGRREKVVISTKQPFYVMHSGDAIRQNLEGALKKLRTSYLDLYLIHAISPDSWEAIKQKKIIEEYEKLRSEGLIRAIAFSWHGDCDGFKEVLDFYDWGMCMVQHNFIDLEREVTPEGVLHAGKKGCALVIMEPLRGGNLAVPPKAIKEIYDEYPQKRPAVEWAFRYLLNFPQVSSILSGVSNMEQLKQNIEIFSKPDLLPGCLTGAESAILNRVREKYLSLASIPCTNCEYCVPCPSNVDIPGVFAKYNDGIMFETFEQSRRSYYFQTLFKEDALLCVECGECEPKCPQKIAIVKEMKACHEKLAGWIE
ncbi:MAG: aldo/keto reductase [Spirochaetes bacterium]|nr:aldo/keto reductase [Spirochaetota bacterium]